MSKQPRPSFATTAVADITGVPPQVINPDQALWPNAGTIRSVNPAVIAEPASIQTPQAVIKQDDLYNKDIKPEKIIFSNKLEASTYLKLQQLATYGGENIQEILESALTAYFVGKEEAARPLPPKVLAVLRKKYPFL